MLAICILFFFFISICAHGVIHLVIISCFCFQLKVVYGHMFWREKKVYIFFLPYWKGRWGNDFTVYHGMESCSELHQIGNSLFVTSLLVAEDEGICLKHPQLSLTLQMQLSVHLLLSTVDTISSERSWPLHPLDCGGFGRLTKCEIYWAGLGVKSPVV